MEIRPPVQTPNAARAPASSSSRETLTPRGGTVKPERISPAPRSQSPKDKKSVIKRERTEAGGSASAEVVYISSGEDEPTEAEKAVYERVKVSCCLGALCVC